MDNWYMDHSELNAFAQAMATADGFRGDERDDDVRNVLRFFEKPWNWTAEYRDWVQQGRPAEGFELEVLRRVAE